MILKEIKASPVFGEFSPEEQDRYPDISCKQYIYICSICDKENVLYEEAHMFYNGICTVCNYESTCNHEIYNDFILVSSETVCYQIVSKCKLCNYFEIELDVEHKFENGNCINEECNVKCPHDYVDGVCSVCGLIEEVGTTETETDTETETETGFNFKISGSSLAKLGAVACVAFLLIVAFYFVDKNFGRKRR